jgi:hypothetical protein
VARQTERSLNPLERVLSTIGSRRFLDHSSHMNRSHHNAPELLAHAPESVGRFLVVLAAIELISMPLTQYAWTWDHFLRGGMDFESNFLFLVVCLGLLLVLRHHLRQDENLPVPWWRLLLPIFDTDKWATMLGTGALVALHQDRRVSSDLATYNLPLQI